MKATERLDAILNLLAESGKVEVSEIVDKLHISPATARRDLDSLASRRLLLRTRGGATKGSVSYDLPGRYNRDNHSPQKQLIAQAASGLIPRGAVVGLCGGTTSTAIAQVLSTRKDLNASTNRPALTVVTNAINIAAQLAVRPNIKIVVTGGIVTPRSYELVGSFADAVLQNITLDLAFIGVNGIDPEVGPTVIDEGEATINSLMAGRATTAYIVADSSKIGERAFAIMRGFHFRNFITDEGIKPADKRAFEAKGIEVTVAR